MNCASTTSSEQRKRSGRVVADAFEMYRPSAIGMRLTGTLDEMVFSGALTPELAIWVLLQFDKSMSAALEKKVTSRAFFKVQYENASLCLAQGFSPCFSGKKHELLYYLLV